MAVLTMIPLKIVLLLPMSLTRYSLVVEVARAKSDGNLSAMEIKLLEKLKEELHLISLFLFLLVLVVKFP
jgi:hypothetical protein